MAKVCELCGKTETPDGHNDICDPCYDNAGNVCEQNARLFAAAPKLLRLAREVADCCWSESEREVLAKAAKEIIATVDDKAPPTPPE